MKVLYFAWLKTKTGISAEEVDPPKEVTTVDGLLDWLQGRDAKFAEALSDREALRVAVNQEYARPNDPVGPGDEVALFPPVTGG